MNQTFDYIVIGAGSAGCLIASRLTEEPAVSVCLIEADGPAPTTMIREKAAAMLRAANQENRT